LTAPYDFQRWLKSLEGRSSAEMFTEGIRACGEAIINLSSDQTSGRPQFARRVAEFLSWLKNSGTVKPESVPAEDWQAYANVARALINKGEFDREILKFWADPDP
jgi:hypothetical protein